MALEKFNWQNGSQVEPAKVEIEGVSYDVVDAQYEGETPLSASNLNLMQDTLLSNVVDTLDDDTKIPNCKAVKDIYSTDEVKTNKVWLDGKPIYSKVLVMIVTSSTYINIDTTNIDNLWIDPSHSFQRVAVGGDNFVGNLPIPMYQSTNNFITVLPNMNQSRITINVGTGAYCHGRCTITTLYTKTTD